MTEETINIIEGDGFALIELQATLPPSLLCSYNGTDVSVTLIYYKKIQMHGENSYRNLINLVLMFYDCIIFSLEVII